MATIPAMSLDEALAIGRLCADEQAGSPPSNLAVLLRAAYTLYLEATGTDRAYIQAILAWARGSGY